MLEAGLFLFVCMPALSLLTIGGLLYWVNR